jgi:ubiquinone/menaquinone biosynthesis C-methylase UbiE
MRELLTRWQTGDVHLRSPLQTRQYELLADAIAEQQPRRVLDWGCGYGQVAALLRERGVDVTPFDWLADALPTSEEMPLERYPGMMAIKSSDPVRLPFAESSFDLVLSVGVLEHVQDPDSSLDEIARVLEPGGRLFIYNLPNRTSWTEFVARRIGAYYHGKYPHDQVYTRASARALLERHGYRVASERYTGMLPQQMPVALPSWAVRALWTINEGLARVPGVNRLATALQMVAHRQSA